MCVAFNREMSHCPWLTYSSTPTPSLATSFTLRADHFYHLSVGLDGYSFWDTLEWKAIWNCKVFLSEFCQYVSILTHDTSSISVLWREYSWPWEGTTLKEVCEILFPPVGTPSSRAPTTLDNYVQDTKRRPALVYIGSVPWCHLGTWMYNMRSCLKLFEKKSTFLQLGIFAHCLDNPCLLFFLCVLNS